MPTAYSKENELGPRNNIKVHQDYPEKRYKIFPVGYVKLNIYIYSLPLPVMVLKCIIFAVDLTFQE